MKTLLIGLGIGAAAMTAALSVPAAGPAHAQTNYPWCAHYGNGTGGGMNCGFTTFQQCLDTVRGIGGFCERNDWYQPPPGPHRQRGPY